MKPAAEFQRHLEERRQAADRLTRRAGRISAARLLAALAGVFAFWLAFVHHGASPLWLLLPIAAFACLARWHDRTLHALDAARRGARFYELALSRLDGTWPRQGETGAAFLDPHHAYAASLDLFGPASLFQFLNTARTQAGEQALAGFLLHPAGIEVAQARQEAVRDLAPRRALREDLFLLGEDVRAGLHPEALASWAGRPAALPGTALRAAAFVLPALTLAGLAFWAFQGSRILFLVSASLQALLFYQLRARVAEVLDSLAQPAHELALVAALLRRLERESFTSPLLATLHQRIASGAAREIHVLARLVEFASQARNAFFAPIAAILLWSLHFAWAIDAWRARHGASIAQWLQTLGEFEALNALAAFAAARPELPYPALASGPAHYQGEDLFHPLLPPHRAVPNSLSLSGAQPLLIISGSNMSGKSTMLRTVGVNAVLAFAGAPVCARSLALTPYALGASIRITDSLHEGSSRFFAEIKQLRLIAELARGPLPLLFLLDEILSGTNSHDRRIGAAAVLRSLLQFQAQGLVTTHDLALTRIAETVTPPGLNLHFEDHLEQGRIVFDYLIRPGVVAKSNALELMRSIGLDVAPE
ncbi:MAG: DNA mismatch repair protein MutS [Acidobacteria bacterium]|nr:DNA mismatch repair protein MutS [Acidobacteriota bacterium]